MLDLRLTPHENTDRDIVLLKYLFSYRGITRVPMLKHNSAFFAYF